MLLETVNPQRLGKVLFPSSARNLVTVETKSRLEGVWL